jgi:hypothetical protein
MDNTTPAAIKEMCRVMQLMIDTKEYGFKLQPESNDIAYNQWNMV